MNAAAKEAAFRAAGRSAELPRQRAERERREAGAEEQEAATAKLEGPTCGAVFVADRTPGCTMCHAACVRQRRRDAEEADVDGQRAWWERWFVQAAKQQEEAKEQAARTFKPSGPRRMSGRLHVGVATIPGQSVGLLTEPSQRKEFFSPSRLSAETCFQRSLSVPFLQEGRFSTFWTLLSYLTPKHVQTACPELCVGAPVPSISTDLFAWAAPVTSLQVPLPHSYAHWLKSPALASGHVIVVVEGRTAAAEASQRQSDFEGQGKTRVLSENVLSTHNMHRLRALNVLRRIFNVVSTCERT